MCVATTRSVEALPPGPGDDAATTRIAIAAQDRPGLFAALAAALSAAGADVVGARVATAGDGTALDVFEVQDGAGLPYGRAEPRRLKRLLARLESAARRDTAPEPAASVEVSRRRAAFRVRPVVLIDARASDTAVVIEVSGANRPGLLAELARVLSAHRLSIRSAHVASFGERAVDSFYVVDARGRKPTVGSRTDALRDALETVLDQRLAAPAGRAVTPARASVRDVSDLSRSRTVSPAPEPR